MNLHPSPGAITDPRELIIDPPPAQTGEQLEICVGCVPAAELEEILRVTDPQTAEMILDHLMSYEAAKRTPAPVAERTADSDHYGDPIREIDPVATLLGRHPERLLVDGLDP